LIPQDFLKYIAKEHSVSNTELDVLSAALNGEPMNAIATRLGIRPEAARKRLGEVYKKFHIAGAGPRHPHHPRGSG
jgi:DNA-binding CsgD family transcriptional regulator